MGLDARPALGAVSIRRKVAVNRGYSMLLVSGHGVCSQRRQPVYVVPLSYSCSPPGCVIISTLLYST